jgi:hypothetical protein
MRIPHYRQFSRKLAYTIFYNLPFLANLLEYHKISFKWSIETSSFLKKTLPKKEMIPSQKHNQIDYENHENQLHNQNAKKVTKLSCNIVITEHSPFRNINYTKAPK